MSAVVTSALSEASPAPGRYNGSDHAENEPVALPVPPDAATVSSPLTEITVDSQLPDDNLEAVENQRALTFTLTTFPNYTATTTTTATTMASRSAS